MLRKDAIAGLSWELSSKNDDSESILADICAGIGGEVRESTAGIEPRGEISHQESLRQRARNQEACAIPAPIPAAQESDVETTVSPLSMATDE